MQSGQLYDLTLAVIGDRSIFEYKSALGPMGVYVLIGGHSLTLFMHVTLVGPLMSMVGEKKMGSMMANPNSEYLVFLRELLDAEKIDPVMDTRDSLSEVSEAIRYLEEGHVRGKVVITCE